MSEKCWGIFVAFLLLVVVVSLTWSYNCTTDWTIYSINGSSVTYIRRVNTGTFHHTYEYRTIPTKER